MPCLLCAGEYDTDALREKWVASKRRVGLACSDDGDNNDGDMRPPKLKLEEVKYQFSTVGDGEEEEERSEDY